MRRWDPALPLRALTELPAAVSAVMSGTRLEAETGPADAIIVLGAAVLPNGQPSGSLLARATAGAALFHEGRAPLVVATGAHHQGPPGEAVVAREILLRAGVPSDRILIEEKSRNTHGNFLFARGLIPEAVRVYVVTEPFHLARALILARKLGFAEPLPWPVLSPAWGRRPDRWRLLLREMGSMALVRAGG
ncbi:hypothetical protein LBMAG42_11150 [Deltaproteobacteria bacterium]|nr:hypothetical protein LBMAG42_11150 [Deltaproteobacteria bacterium]